jgi:predicted nucleic acid-binding protein
MATILVDTGPLAALLNPADRWHQWTVEQFRDYSTPLLTCESVVSEAAFILRRYPNGCDALLGLFRQGVVQVAFDFQAELHAVERLVRRYTSVPMSIADACLTRMSELYGTATICSLDADFRIYRRNGRQQIPLHCPI